MDKITENIYFIEDYILKNLILFALLGLGGCSLVALPVAVVGTAASIAKVPVSVVGSVADAVSGDDDEKNEE